AESELSAYHSAAKLDLQAQKPRDHKLRASMEEAIRRSGLRDGMTVSFHHAFRGGDLTINLLMATIAQLGFKNLALASSWLSDCHSPRVEHICDGGGRCIYTSGLLGPLAEEISRRRLAAPGQIGSRGGGVHRVQIVELGSY
ncbi:citrate lyase subunit alpha, partial [Salmonella enterica]|uniref:citrate lyase subunit alpha n=1 Tax=Salmonella enterica TaxID=28901 RepID=UPI000A5EABCB